MTSYESAPSPHLQFVSNGARVCTRTPESWMLVFVTCTLTGGLYGDDVFVWLVTGFGKSVIYEVLPSMFGKKLDRGNSLVFIVSPLVSLIVDQVHTLSVLEGPYALLKDVH